MWCSKGQASPQRWRSSFFVDDPLPPEPKAGPDNISPGFSSDPIPFSHHNILVIHLASYWISSVASRLRYSITAVHLLYMLATKYLGFEMVFTPMCFSKDNLPPIHSLYLFLSHHTLSPASHTLALPVFVSSHSLSPCCAPVNSFPPAWWTSCWWWLRIVVIPGVILGIAHIDLLTNALGPPSLCWFLFLLLVISMMRLPLGWQFTCIDLLTSALGPQSLCWSPSGQFTSCLFGYSAGNIDFDLLCCQNVCFITAFVSRFIPMNSHWLSACAALLLLWSPFALVRFSPLVCLFDKIVGKVANSLFFYCQPCNNQPVLDEWLQSHKRWVGAWLWIIWRCFYSNRATLLWLKKLGKVY